MAIMVRVSVVIAFHRVDDYLKLAIDSITASTENDIEVLLVADRLPSSAIDKLNESLTDFRVKILKSPGVGAGDARNEGFQAAKGKYIAILDSDDVSFPDRLRKQANYLDLHPDVVAVGSQLEMITDKGVVVGFSNYPERVSRSFLHKPFDSMIANPSSMIRKDSLEIVGGYRTQFSSTVEDLDLWNRLLRIGRIAILPDVLISYRIHENQNTSSNAGEISWHLRIVQLLDIYETYGNGKFSLEGLGVLNPKMIAILRSKQARRNLGFKGRVRFAVYEQLHKGDENAVGENGSPIFDGLLGNSPGLGPRVFRVLNYRILPYIVNRLHHCKFFRF
jgi:glycosyltransferase involved in cell wall biosynthesis